MTSVDFYQLSRDPVERVIAELGRTAMGRGLRLLVVSGDAQQREVISQALWAENGPAFLAHGEATAPHAARQPILLSESCDAVNEARMAIVADGVWREDLSSMDGVKLLFGPEQTQPARELWTALGARENFALRIFKQREDGAWREGR